MRQSLASAEESLRSRFSELHRRRIKTENREQNWMLELMQHRLL